MPRFRITRHFISFRESQNRRVGRDPQGSSSPTGPAHTRPQEPHHVRDRALQTLLNSADLGAETKPQALLPRHKPSPPLTAANPRRSCPPAPPSPARSRSEAAGIRGGPAASAPSRPHSPGNGGCGSAEEPRWRRASGERGSRGRRRRAGPGRANGARAGGSLNPLSRAARPGPVRLQSGPLPPLGAMDVTRSFFGKLRELALTVEKEVKQMERAMRREDVGKSGPRPWVGGTARRGTSGPGGFAVVPRGPVLHLRCRCPLCSSGSAFGGPGDQPGSSSAGNCSGSSSSPCLSELCGCVAEVFITGLKWESRSCFSFFSWIDTGKHLQGMFSLRTDSKGF